MKTETKMWFPGAHPIPDATYRPTAIPPSLAEAENSLELSQQRFLILCATGDQDEIIKLLDNWSGTLDDINKLNKAPEGLTLRICQQSHDSPCPCSHRPLCEAARYGHASLLKYLASRGFELFSKHAETERLETIPQAALRGAPTPGYIKVLDMLLRHGWDINDFYAKGPGDPLSALSCTLVNKNSSETALKWLLDHGADPNGRSILWCLTITTISVLRSPLSTLKMLVEAGGIVAGSDTVPLVAKDNEHSASRVAMIEYLLDHGAPIDKCACSAPGSCPHEKDPIKTALHIAITKNDPDLVKLLLERGADREIQVVFKKPFHGNPPRNTANALEFAKYCGHEKIVELLEGKDGKAEEVEELGVVGEVIDIDE